MIQGIVLDWAGTAIDYGSTAPAQVFVRAFANAGIELSLDEARRPMGLAKRDHVRELLKMERIAAQFARRYGHQPEENDVDLLYGCSEQLLHETVGQHCEPLPGVLDVVKGLRACGLRIGSTTGYSRRLMDEIVIPAARAQGYEPDAVVTPDEVLAGRPFPFMCYLVALRLGLWPLWQCVKVGDTRADIAEGINAGMWTVGVLQGSSLVGCSREEEAQLSPEALQRRQATAREAYTVAGAHLIIDDICDLPEALAQIHKRMSEGERPDMLLRDW